MIPLFPLVSISHPPKFTADHPARARMPRPLNLVYPATLFSWPALSIHSHTTRPCCRTQSPSVLQTS
eukprot:472790-Hanusia_phi.AAC.4